MGNDDGCLWLEWLDMSVTAPALVVRQLRGIQNVLRMVGLFQFSWLFKDQSSLEASGIG